MSKKVPVVFEYSFNSSVNVLFNRLSTASGLTEWFADDVKVQGKKYTFIWGETEQIAEMIAKREGRYVRFTWVEDENHWFEFRISIDELTGDLSLIISDFCEEDEKEETEELWNTQVADLKHVIGSS